MIYVDPKPAIEGAREVRESLDALRQDVKALQASVERLQRDMRMAIRGVPKTR